MVVSLNSALVSKSSSNIAFGNSHKNSVRLVPQEGDKFLSTGITHQKSFMRKARTLALAALTMFGAYSCTTKDEPIPVTPPVVVVPPVVPPVVNPPTSDANLTVLEKKFKTIMAPVFAIDSSEVGAVDSVLVNNAYDATIDGYGYNAAKSSKDTLVFNTSSTYLDGTPISKGTNKYFINKEGNIELKSVFDGMTDFKRKFRISANQVLENIDNKDCYKYTKKSAYESVKEILSSNSGGEILKATFHKMR